MASGMAPNDAPQVLLMPLSFASMLGGMCTLIGTSTNLVLNAQIIADRDAPLPPLSMFSMTLVGLPSAVVGIFYLAIASPLIFRSASLPSAEHPGQLESSGL